MHRAGGVAGRPLGPHEALRGQSYIYELRGGFSSRRADIFLGGWAYCGQSCRVVAGPGPVVLRFLAVSLRKVLDEAGQQLVSPNISVSALEVQVCLEL